MLHVRIKLEIHGNNIIDVSSHKLYFVGHATKSDHSLVYARNQDWIASMVSSVGCGAGLWSWSLISIRIAPRIPGVVHMVSSRALSLWRATPVPHRRSLAHSTICLSPIQLMSRSLRAGFWANLQYMQSFLCLVLDFYILVLYCMIGCCLQSWCH